MQVAVSFVFQARRAGVSLVPQITIDGPLNGVLTQFVLARPKGNRCEQFSHLRRREIKVPSPPTREDRGEGKAVREVPVLVVASCCEVTFLLDPVAS